MTLTFFKILSFGNIGFWILAGILIVGSNYYGFNIINSIIGFIFFLIAYFWYRKYKNFTHLITEIRNNKTLSNSIETIVKQTLSLELILIIISFLLALLLTTGAASRMFSEKMSVFG